MRLCCLREGVRWRVVVQRPGGLWPVVSPRAHGKREVARVRQYLNGRCPHAPGKREACTLVLTRGGTPRSCAPGRSTGVSLWRIGGALRMPVPEAPGWPRRSVQDLVRAGGEV